MRWLPFAATPTFALMALLTAVLDGGADGVTCLGMAGASPLSSMSLMYLLMAAFHVTPWANVVVRGSRSLRRVGSASRFLKFFH